MDDDELTFGQWLQRRRKALHLTQQQLGDLAGCASETIRKYEADSRRPAPDILDHLAAALQIPERDHAAFRRFAGGDLVDLSVAVPVAAPASRPLHAPSNLPVPLTPLIGRVDEVAAVVALLGRPEVRLLTLTGPGGVGKTRLSIAVAEMLRNAFMDGTFFVDLAPISDPDLVLSTIANTLGVTEAAGEPLLARVQAYLRDRQLLLLLDNFEQVLAAGLVVADLLRAAPRLTIVVTSRAPLRLRGEHEVAVDALALPGTDVRDVDALTHYDAVRLFIERAQAVKADFQVTNANALAVAEICARLDGLPLAIELAAARVKLLQPEALLARLRNRLQLLTGGQRDLPARQQTIRATIDWSYELLTPDEQRLFRRLAVFVGGATLEAIEVVCTAEADLTIDPFDGVASLLDKSLVQQEEGPAEEPRYVMLETIHEYAREHLQMSGEAMLLERRHATYFLMLAEASEAALRGPHQSDWLHRLEAEHANLRAALATALAQADTELALRLAGALWQFWDLGAFFSEGRHWLERVLAVSQDSSAPARIKAYSGAGTMAWYQGDYTLATVYHEQALALARQVGDKHAEAFALNNLGVQAKEQGLYGTAELWLVASLALALDVGDPQLQAYVYMSLGETARLEGDYRRATELYEQSLARWRALGSGRDEALVLFNLGEVTYSQDGERRAAEQYQASLQLAVAHGDRWVTVACLDRLAGLTARQGHVVRAARLFGAAATSRMASGWHYGAADAARYNADVAAARAQLAEADWVAAWTEGQAMTLEQAICFARENPSDEPV